jgi:hypothetical protein
LGKIRLNFRHLLQHVVDHQELFGVDGLSHQVGLERSDFELTTIFERAVLSGVIDNQPPITRAAYPMKRARSGNEGPSQAAISRYVSCKSVVTLRLAGGQLRASCRVASRCNSAYRALKNTSVSSISARSVALTGCVIDSTISCHKQVSRTAREQWLGCDSRMHYQQESSRSLCHRLAQAGPNKRPLDAAWVRCCQWQLTSPHHTA